MKGPLGNTEKDRNSLLTELSLREKIASLEEHRGQLQDGLPLSIMWI